MDKKLSEKFKEGVSSREIEDFARKYITEIFAIATIIIATASSCWNFFLSGPKLALVFVAIAMIASMLFPEPLDRATRRLYLFIFKQQKTTQIILGAVKIVIALFIPFIIFGVIGLLAGNAFHHYFRHGQSMGGGGRPSLMDSNEGGETD